MPRGRPRLVSLEGPAVRRAKVASREGIDHRPEFVSGMLPGAVRYLDGLRKCGKSKPLSTEEQAILDSCLFLEALTGKQRNKAAIVAALANLQHSQNASDWMTILHRRKLVEFEELTIRLRSSGRAKAKPPSDAPTTEALHQRVSENQRGPYLRGLKALIARYPQAYTRAEFATAADIDLESFSLGHSIKSLLLQRLIEYTSDYQLIASAALFPARAVSDSAPMRGMPVKEFAPLFDQTPRAVRSAIGAGVFPIQTYLHDNRRYADRKVVSAYFAAKNAERSGALS